MPATISNALLATRASGVLTLTLNRPEALNSLTTELLDDLATSLREVETDASVRAVVITGAGRAFSAGQDLKAQLEGDGIDLRSHLREHYLPVIEGMRSLEKPIIAAVNGVAAGAGMSLALAADLRVAGDAASFVQAFVRVGLVPDAAATYYLPRLVGLGRAMELAMLGESIDSRAALAMGLVNRVVADEELATAVGDLASRLASGPRSLGLIKRALSVSLDNEFDKQFRVEETAQLEALDTDDFREGVNAFREKRPASFSGA
ncbi:MAG: enoyl-CoA hydratase-related protein [Candidatus Dormibacteria bacterium]